MTASVRIPMSAALDARDALNTVNHGPWLRAFKAIDAAIAKAERSSATAKRLPKRQQAKRAKKKEETSAIRAQVFERSCGSCELCGDAFTYLEPGEFHHAFGRVRVKQAVSNTLAICRACHRGVTESRPSADYWLDRQSVHFYAKGYSREYHMAQARLGFVRVRKSFGGTP